MGFYAPTFYELHEFHLYFISSSLILQYFQKDMPANFEADPEGVIHLAFSIKINQKKMKKLEKEYTTMKTKEKEDEIELRVSQDLQGHR